MTRGGSKGFCHIHGTGDSVYSSTVEYITHFKSVSESRWWGRGDMIIQRGRNEGGVRYKGPTRACLC